MKAELLDHGYVEWMAQVSLPLLCPMVKPEGRAQHAHKGLGVPVVAHPLSGPWEEGRGSRQQRAGNKKRGES